LVYTTKLSITQIVKWWITEWCSKKWLWPNLMYYLGICLEGKMKTRLCIDLNPGLGNVLTQLWHLIDAPLITRFKKCVLMLWVKAIKKQSWAYVTDFSELHQNHLNSVAFEANCSIKRPYLTRYFSWWEYPFPKPHTGRAPLVRCPQLLSQCTNLQLPSIIICRSLPPSARWPITNPVAPEPEGSSPYSQEPATGPYPDPTGSNLHSPP
jgi:hypothetical protein